MKFAHLGDCHLGGWRQPELRDLNFKSFQYAIDKCISENVEFVLIAGDLFDSAYPSIETLKESFKEFRRLKDKNIPVFLIAGSHDYSVSGKTFLEVLEKSGFCTNVVKFEEKNESIILLPTIHKNIALYGYPGRKSGLEVDDIMRMKISDSPGLFRILMLHTTIQDAVRNPQIKSVDERVLPNVDYTALGHLHIEYNKNKKVYSGPTFPNNLSELIELGHGLFYIYDNGLIKKEVIKLKSVLHKQIEIKDGLIATDEIIAILDKEEIADKIVVLKLSGTIQKGKLSDINFSKIEAYLKKRGAYTFLKSTSKLNTPDQEIKIDFNDIQNIESQIIKRFEENHVSKFNGLIESLIKSLQIEKLEDEKIAIFEDRLVSELRKVLSI
jgi:DNA repair protein SbcD/Mre11